MGPTCCSLVPPPTTCFPSLSLSLLSLSQATNRAWEFMGSPEEDWRSEATSDSRRRRKSAAGWSRRSASTDAFPLSSLAPSLYSLSTEEDDGASPLCRDRRRWEHEGVGTSLEKTDARLPPPRGGCGCRPTRRPGQ